jgi:acyl dehydratase
MLTFKDFSVEQVYRAGPYVVTDDDAGNFHQALGGDSAHEMLSFAEQEMFRQWAAAALTMKMVATGELQVVGGTQGLGVDELEWGTSIKTNDVLTLESRVIMVRGSRSAPNFGIVTMQTTTKNQNGDVVQVCTHSVRVAK